jgi:hypothetical protein
MLEPVITSSPRMDRRMSARDLVGQAGRPTLEVVSTILLVLDSNEVTFYGQL